MTAKKGKMMGLSPKPPETPSQEPPHPLLPIVPSPTPHPSAPVYTFQAPPVELLSHLFAQAEDLLFRVRLLPSRAIEYISPSVERLTGYRPEELIEQPDLMVELVHLRDLAPRETSQPTRRTVPITVKDGARIWLEVSLTPVLADTGQVIAVDGIGRDMTEWVKAEQQAAIEQAQLQSVIATATDAIIVLDAGQKIVMNNPAAEKMFAYPPGGLSGRPLDDLIPGRARPLHARWVEAFGATGEVGHPMGPTRVTTGLSATGAEFPIEASLSTFVVGEQRFYTAIIRDITERKQTEDKLLHLSTHDPLTGLYNRSYFDEACERLEASLPRQVSVVIADLDNLKYMNDMYGHASGDELLRDVAEVFQSAFRAEDVVARLGGDEFGVLLPNTRPETTAQAIQRIRQRLAAYNRLNQKMQISLSVGTATLQPGETIKEAIRRADEAMYREKHGRAGLRRELID